MSKFEVIFSKLGNDFRVKIAPFTKPGLCMHLVQQWSRYYDMQCFLNLHVNASDSIVVRTWTLLHCERTTYS